jgi:outer membrane protein TolC
VKSYVDHIFIILFACCVLTGCYPSVSNLAPQSSDLPWQSSVDEDCECNASKNFALPPHCVPPYQSAEELVDPNYVYTLAELIDLAQRNNPKTRIAWEQAKQAAYAVGLSLATFLPQISIDALVGYQHLAIPLPKFVSPTGKIYIDLAETLPSFVIEWLLFDFGKRDCELESAKYLSYASNVAFTEAHQQLIFDIVKAYFDFNAARTQLHVAEGALKNTEIVQDAAESRQIRGLEKTTEVAIARRETA